MANGGVQQVRRRPAPEQFDRLQPHERDQELLDHNGGLRDHLLQPEAQREWLVNRRVHYEQQLGMNAVNPANYEANPENNHERLVEMEDDVNDLTDAESEWDSSESDETEDEDAISDLEDGPEDQQPERVERVPEQAGQLVAGQLINAVQLAFLQHQANAQGPFIEPNRLPPIEIGRTIELPIEFPGILPERDDNDTFDQVLLKELQGLRSERVHEHLIKNNNDEPYECAVCFLPMAAAVRCRQCTTTGRNRPADQPPELSSSVCVSCFHEMTKNAIVQRSLVSCPICRRNHRVDEIQLPTVVLLSNDYNF